MFLALLLCSHLLKLNPPDSSTAQHILLFYVFAILVTKVAVFPDIFKLLMILKFGEFCF
jgi:hypothetical protein